MEVADCIGGDASQGLVLRVKVAAVFTSTSVIYVSSVLWVSGHCCAILIRTE